MKVPQVNKELQLKGLTELIVIEATLTALIGTSAYSFMTASMLRNLGLELEDYLTILKDIPVSVKAYLGSSNNIQSLSPLLSEDNCQVVYETLLRFVETECFSYLKSKKALFISQLFGNGTIADFIYRNNETKAMEERLDVLMEEQQRFKGVLVHNEPDDQINTILAMSPAERLKYRTEEIRRLNKAYNIK